MWSPYRRPNRASGHIETEKEGEEQVLRKTKYVL